MTTIIKELIKWIKSKKSNYPKSDIERFIKQYESMSDSQIKHFAVNQLKPVIDYIDPFIDLYLTEYNIEDITDEDYNEFKKFLIALTSFY